MPTLNRNQHTSAFLSLGFRPFFLVAAIWAVLGMVIWILILARILTDLPIAQDPVSWHAHELLFGYLSAVIAGFLLTAVPNWTGRPPLAGIPLLVLLIVWIFGRIAVLLSAMLPALVVLLADISFMLALGCVVLQDIVSARNWKNLVVIAILGVFVAGNAMFHLQAFDRGHVAFGIRLGLAAVIMMIAVIGGRVIPAFTRNWLKAKNCDALPAQFGLLDKLALLVTFAVLLMWVLRPSSPATGYALFAGGLLQVGRLLRWQGFKTLSEPLVWILHIGYLFVALGMFAMGGRILWENLLIFASAHHFWLVGGVGIMTLGMMTRVTLGHTGRKLTAGAATFAMYAFVIAAVMLRALASLVFEQVVAMWVVAGVFWCCGFGLFLCVYSPMLWQLRKS